ncbi:MULTISPECIES: hypothetical protein [unclassified Bradyrhizobium]|uniref:hypothetical protein n=1 Tax=unclassified Bradyrhizobium TaxID=2631580 RepID=UPI0028E6B382|nr:MULTISPECIES: hypothetical protein [unclassified Bradyrhizobium]
MTDVQRLQDRIEQLEHVLGVGRSFTDRLRELFGLETEKAIVLGMLYKREFVTRDGLYTVLYGSRPECDWPDEKVLDLQIFMLRRAIKSTGVTITTKWGAGWYMPADSKAVIRGRIEAQQLEVAAVASLRDRRLAFLDGR